MNLSSNSRFSQAQAGPTRGTRETTIASSDESSIGETPANGALTISETFTSRQGEGKLTGAESFFVRTSGCNLRCHFCDTPYASWNPSGQPMSIDDIVNASIDAKVQHVVLTGGEPLLPSKSVDLCHRLREAGMHVTIETAGTIDRELVCDLASISPKLSNSSPSASEHPRWSELHEQRRMPIETMKRLIARSVDHQIKFVVSSVADFAEIDTVVRQLNVDNEDVWIMPEGVTNEAMDLAKTWLEPECDPRGYRYCDRMQIRWYGNRRGT